MKPSLRDYMEIVQHLSMMQCKDNCLPNPVSHDIRHGDGAQVWCVICRAKALIKKEREA